jgi:hypothetical protein
MYLIIKFLNDLRLLREPLCPRVFVVIERLCLPRRHEGTKQHEELELQLNFIDSLRLFSQILMSNSR